jgi:hypothetical protein
LALNNFLSVLLARRRLMIEIASVPSHENIPLTTTDAPRSVPTA